MTERIWEKSALFMKHIIACKIFVCFEWLLQQKVHKTSLDTQSGCRGDGYNRLQSTLSVMNWKFLLQCILIFGVSGINIISTVQSNDELLRKSLYVLYWINSSTQQTKVLKQHMKTYNALMFYLRVTVNQRVL